MENLLKKGQIKSEHIPMVVFELAALEVLDLESTKLNMLPDIYNQMLTELYLSNNFLQSIQPSIYNLLHLQVLDVSHNLLIKLSEDIGHLTELRVLRLTDNNIEDIPSAIGDLKKLEELNLSQNKISRLPPEINGLAVIKVLILANNKIQTLPDEICQLMQLHTLDLTDNEIHTLPMAMHQLKNITMAHSFHKFVKCGLWLYKNPLVQPPPEIWRTEKADTIFEYLRKRVTFKTENLEYQKMQVLGESQCGKTSLVRVLALRKPCMTNESQDKTRLLQQTKWKTANKVKFVFDDFSGDIVYRILYRLFLDRKALVLLVYNAATFSEETFYSSIGQWLDMLSASTPGVIVKIVGTHADLLHPQRHEHETQTTDNDQEAQADNDQRAHENKSKITVENVHKVCANTAIQDNMLEPDSQQMVIEYTGNLATEKTSHKGVMQDMLARFFSSRQARIEEDVYLSETEIKKLEMSGQHEMNDVGEAELYMLKMRQKRQKQILQTPLKIIPEISLVSASSLEGIHDLTGELELLGMNKNLFPHAHKQIPDHWRQFKLMLKQRKGYCISWTDAEQTAELFGIKGVELTECLKNLNNTADILWCHKDPGLYKIIFHRPKMLVRIIVSLYRHDAAEFLNYDNKVFLCRGGLSKEQFLECVDTFRFTGKISRPFLNCFWFPFNFNKEDISQLLELLPLFGICYTVPEPIVCTEPLYSQPLMVLPWFNKDNDTYLLRDLWTTEKAKLKYIYSFPYYYFPDIFPILSAKIQNFVDERMDWKDYTYARRETEKLLLQQSFKEDHVLLTVEVRGPDLTKVKNFMEEIVNVVNIQLERYPGLDWKLQGNYQF